MKVIVAGSRRLHLFQLKTYNDWKIKHRRRLAYTLLEDAIKDSGFEITEVVSGCCWGMDQLGEEWAANNNKEVIPFPAQWTKYGKAAGYKRNRKMAEAADALICIYHGSSGSQDMIDQMRKKEKPVFPIDMSRISLNENGSGI